MTSAMCAIAALMLLLGVALGQQSSVRAAPGATDEVVGYVVEGTGNGHGRGLSQWGAYGWAVDHGWSWTQILDHYYGGTVPGSIPVDSIIRVRLTDWDGASWLGVTSTAATIRWSGASGQSGGATRSVRVVETSANRFDISSNAAAVCPGASTLTVPDGPLSNGVRGSDDVRRVQTFLTAFGYEPGGIDGWFGNQTESSLRAFQTDEGLPVDGIWSSDDAVRARSVIASATSDSGWTSVASGVSGPIVLTTDASESNSAPGDVLGLCASSGQVTHYRGSISMVDTTGGNRVVNELRVENYLRGVVPREVSASWGDRGDGAGMNALRAQAVAARSYGVTQTRYDYAGTCDTSSCQVYAGAATRATASSTSVSAVEQTQTDTAIAETAGVVRVWAEGNLPGASIGGIVSTEFSASNGPRTAGGNFPSVVDVGDSTSLNPNHRWTRILTVDAVRARYPGIEPDRVTTVIDPDSPYVGIYANCVRLAASADDNCDGGSNDFVSAWTFRNAFSLPSPGFTVTPILREVAVEQSMFFIGDSVGESIAASGQELPGLVSGSFSSVGFDALSSRRTEGGSIQPDGVAVARSVPMNTDLVVVELGYNDDASAMPTRIDSMMTALNDRGVGLVLWVTMSERRLSGEVPRYAAANQALRDARGRWTNLVIIDWDAASASGAGDRWYSDGVHLTATGQAQFALWLREQMLSAAEPAWLSASNLEHHVPLTPARILDTRVPIGVASAGRVADSSIEVKVLGEGGVPGTGVRAVALNLTLAEGGADRYGGFVTVYPCGVVPDTSNLNFVDHQTVANTVLAPVSDVGSVCLFVRGSGHLILDVSGYYPASSGFEPLTPIRVLDTRRGLGAPIGRITDAIVEFPVTGVGGLPDTGLSAVSLNLTVTETQLTGGPGFATVYDCSELPDTSNLNFAAAQSVANAVIAPVSEAGTVCVAVSGAVQLIADVAGYFPTDSGLVPLSPTRLSDTRLVGRVGDVEGTAGPLEVQVVDDMSINGRSIVAAVLNVTTVDPDTGPYGGFLTVYPCGRRPNSSNLNFVDGATVANGVVAPLSRDGKVCVYSYGSSDILVDLNGLITS